MAEQKSPRSEALGLVTNVIVIAVVVLVLLRPDASLRTWWKERRVQIELMEAISEVWPELTEAGSRIGDRGDDDLTVVEFGDYECPYCRVSHESYERLLAQNPGLTLIYRHLPIPQLHPMATDAARASICAEEAGSFEAMHDLLYETEDWMQDPDWGDIARGLGVSDLPGFEECLSSKATEERLVQDRLLAEALELRATPAFLGPQGVHMGLLDQPALNRILGQRSGT